MAILRRGNGQVSGSIWPGFVDAMTALLMILMFVLTIFMVVQFVLRETITGQDEELNNLTVEVAEQEVELNSLSAQIAGLADALGLEQVRSEGLQNELTGVQDDLLSAQTQITQQNALIGTLTKTTDDQQNQITSFEQQVAGLLGQRNDLTSQLSATRATISDLEAQQAKAEKQAADLENQRDELTGQLSSAQGDLSKTQAEKAKLLSEKEVMQLALAQARDEIDLQVEQARLAAAKREALQALVADLNANISKQTTEIDTIKTELAEEEKERLLESAAAQALKARLKKSQDELTAMTLVLEAKRKDAEDTLTLLAAAQAAKTTAENLFAEQLSEKEKQTALLAQANNLLKDEQALSAESQRKVTLLNQQTNALRGQLNALQNLLDAAAEKDAEAQIQIESLGSNLNSALARVATEQKLRADLEAIERERLEAEATDLKKFRSEFFGRLREVLVGQEGIRIVGDRFVFSSEILYTAGSAELGESGKAEIRKIANIIQEVADQIPEGIDWILRVDGHTDNTQLSGFGRYKNNWELSQARALAVVKYLIEDLEIPANRLAANGFGEFQPIAEGDSEDALAQNRRIELKFTEK